MDTDGIVRDYLARLETAAAGLPRSRRVELVGEVREHIDTALAEAGRSDEVTVRNVLERLGSPEEIVAAEVGSAIVSGVPSAGTGLDAAVTAAPARSRMGGVEVAAVLALGLAWPALLLPYGLLLWLTLGIIGLVLTWLSAIWSTRRKLVVTVIRPPRDVS